MRKVAQRVGWLLLLPLPVMAQFSTQPHPTPKAEVYGGYSFLHIEELDVHGWNFSIAGNVNRNLGIVGEASGHYDSDEVSGPSGTTKSSLDLHSFMAGPRISERGLKWFTPYAHALFGMTRVNGKQTTTPPGGSPATTKEDETGFSLALGGGLDLNASDGIFFRLIQADYYLIRLDDEKHAGARISAGILFRFGRRSD